MWICAKCGTEAQQPETCSGCGSSMKPFGQPPKEERYKFVLIAHFGKLKASIDCYGPFDSVLAADQWWDNHAASRVEYGWKDYEVVLMEAPNNE